MTVQELLDGAMQRGTGLVWTDETITAVSRQAGTLVASMDTGLVYWSERLWRHAPTALRERPAAFVYVPDEIVTRIHADADGLWPGEYLEWDGSGLIVCGGP